MTTTPTAQKTETLLTEIASSVRMLMRHAMTSPQGAGVPPGELFNQIRKLDKALGKPPHRKEGKWVPGKKHPRGHVDPEEAFSKPVLPQPSPEPPKNGVSKPKPEEEDSLLVLKNGKWSLKK